MLGNVRVLNLGALINCLPLYPVSKKKYVMRMEKNGSVPDNLPHHSVASDELAVAAWGGDSVPGW